ncbi:protein XcpP [Pseudomonas gingeri]|uniref:Protein XcpP n=1 Tax=Pseudomonas gingeri TaxID=117681 RepID=A0A7Y8C3G9_9PSED|nr:type II secretion system protein N [Pseudomonas gingeri]NWA28853.1 protein XcpP [Pseudomonas gingeri]NWB97337.1 protein XcpP [Pseudomonas gingeri]NWD76374.1 protein XcpP [Pseudomonas gingeri]
MGFLSLALCALPLGYAALSLWGERIFRQALPTLPTVQANSRSVPAERAPLNHAAVATVMGLVAQESLARSAEPLKLQASFVSSAGDSRALLAGASGQRIYRVGESLPGGSVLRRIESGRVVLWRNGREELLSLEPPGRPILQAFKEPVAGAPVSSLYLRPTATPRQSE